MQYEVGLVCGADNVCSLMFCIRRVLQDNTIVEKYRKNDLEAKQELYWENEKQVLINA